MIDIKPFIKTCIDLKITPNQFIWLYLVMIKDYALIYEYMSKMNHLDYEGIIDLIDREFVIDLNKNNSDLHPDALLITDKFSKYFITVDVKDAKEFWDKYPSTIKFDGRTYKSKTSSKSKEEILADYQRAINYDENTHKLAMKCLEHDIKKGAINTKIEKYINGKPWEDFKEEEVKPKSDVI